MRLLYNDYYGIKFQDTRVGLQRIAGDFRHYCFRLYLRTGVDMIGMCGIVYRDFSKEENQLMKEEGVCYELGYWLHEKYVGKGYVTEAIERLIKFGRENLFVNNFVIICDERNVASINIAKRIHFEIIHTERTRNVSREDWGEFTLLHFKKAF